MNGRKRKIVKLEVRNMSGDVVDSVDALDDVFDAPMNPALLHQVMVGQLANKRQGTRQGEDTLGSRGRRREAATAEVHRTRAAGFYPLSAVARRRRRIRPHPREVTGSARPSA